MKTHVVYLTRRNLKTLLNKLDRNKSGGDSLCTIIKYDTWHPDYPQTMSACAVRAVEDDDYYTDREAGEVHPDDVPAQARQ